MKKIILVVSVLFITFSCKEESKNKVEVSDAKEVKQVNRAKATLVDAENSIVNWKGFKPTGEHFGLISISEGTINITDGNLIGGSFKFDMNSIVDTDMAADNEYNAKLVSHLTSPDFFDVEKFPTATFEITEVVENGGKLNVSGNLTIKGTIKNITIPATLSDVNGVTVFKSDVFTIDRTDFDVRYGSKKFFDDLKDKFINDKFELSFEVKITK